MRKILPYIISFILLLIAVPTGSAKTAINNPEPLKYHLDNGLTVILLENHAAPVLTVQCWVNAGSVTEREYSGSGISHYVEHMLFKGTKRRAVGQIGEEVKDLGGRINAYTSFERTVYHITASNQKPGEILDILSDAVFNSSFDPGEVRKEGEVILKEINLYKDNPRRYMSRLAWDTMFDVHPYGMPVIGYEDVFKKLTREDLLTYYNRMYVPDNMILVIVGAFNTGQMKERVQKHFGRYSRSTVEPVAPIMEPAQVAYREVIREYAVNTSYLSMGYHGPDLYSEDLYAMDVLAIILGQGQTSRLYKDLREDLKLVYSISSWSYTPRDPGVFGIDASLDEENVYTVKQAVIKHINKMKKEPVKSGELERAKVKLTNDQIFSRETVEGLAGKLGSDEIYTHSLDFSDNYIRKVREVTPEDIMRVAARYFRNDNLTVVILVPEKDEAETADVEESAQSPEISRVVLDNGITLLMREDHRLPVVSISAVFQGGLRAEDKDNNGICNIMRNVMKRGTKTRTAHDIASIMEERGASLSPFTGRNSFGFKSRMISKDFETGMDVLADVILNSSFPENEVDKEKSIVLNGIRTYDDNMLNSAKRLIREAVFKGHPYSFIDIGREEIVKNLSRQDLVSLRNKLVSPRNMVIAVYGDINPDEVKLMTEKYFRFTEDRTKEVELEQRHAAFPEDIREVFKKVDKRQTALFMGFKGVDIYNSDRYVFEVLTNVLSSLGGRLFEALRGKQGLAYMVGAFNIIGVDPGSFVFYVVTEKDKKEKALKGIIKEIEKIQSKSITEEELSRAKAGLIGTHSLGIQTNYQLAFKTALDELYGLGYDDYLKYSERINSVTLEDIKRVARQYFDLSKYALVEVGK